MASSDVWSRPKAASAGAASCSSRRTMPAEPGGRALGLAFCEGFALRTQTPAGTNPVDGDQGDANRDHGNPQGGGTDIGDEQDGSDEHQCDGDPDEGRHDSTSVGPNDGL